MNLVLFWWPHRSQTINLIKENYRRTLLVGLLMQTIIPPSTNSDARVKVKHLEGDHAEECLKYIRSPAIISHDWTTWSREVFRMFTKKSLKITGDAEVLYEGYWVLNLRSRKKRNLQTVIFDLWTGHTIVLTIQFKNQKLILWLINNTILIYFKILI